MNYSFSIILPTYNVSEHLNRCIRSIQAQTFIDFEMIFVDDCGVDNSIDIIESHAQNDDRIKIIKHKKNLGTYHARATGVRAAEGKYLVFLDPDDEIKPDLLLRLAEKINSSPDIIFYGVNFIPARPWYKKKAFLYADLTQGTIPGSICNKRGNEFLWGATPGKCFRKDFYIDVLENLNIQRDFRFVYAEDQLVIYVSYFQAKSIENLYYDGYIYYKNDTSISKLEKNKDLSLQLEQYQYFLDKLYLTMKSQDLPISHQIIFDRLFSYLKSNYYLISRHQSHLVDYLECLDTSNKLDFKFRKLFAIFIYYFTFGKVRV